MKTTQIGSLPFTDISEAIDFSFEHSIPFVPDLPKINSNEFMLEQAKLSDKDAYQQIAIEAFLKRLEESGFNGEVKNQLPGPLCLSRYLDWSFQKASKYWEVMFIDRVEKFQRTENPFWLFIDEPSLFQESEEDRQKLFQVLKPYSDIKIAIHYCGSHQINLHDWPQGIALSYDSSLHILPQTRSILFGGISPDQDQLPDLNRFYGLTAPCGLYGEKDPYSFLKFVNTVSK